MSYGHAATIQRMPCRFCGEPAVFRSALGVGMACWEHATLGEDTSLLPFAPLRLAALADERDFAAVVVARNVTDPRRPQEREWRAEKEKAFRDLDRAMAIRTRIAP